MLCQEYVVLTFSTGNGHNCSRFCCSKSNVPACKEGASQFLIVWHQPQSTSTERVNLITTVTGS